MLSSLNIKNYVLIDSLDIRFPAGLIIMTGQTGAGKSIILGALSLVLGSKADASVIGVNGESCVVEAEFTVDSDEQIASLCNEYDVDLPESGQGLVIRRVLNKSGRSRSFVNDCPVSVKMLSELSSKLIDIHSQHQTILLRDKVFQMSMLDHYADDGELLTACRDGWKRFCALKKEYEALCDNLARLNAEQQYNAARYEQLAKASLKDGELEELELEQKQLANAEEIKSSLCRIESLLGDDGTDESLSVNSRLKESSRILEKLVDYLPGLAVLSERIESARLEIDDVFSEITDKESAVEVSDERLEYVEARLSLLYDLMKKHGCRTVAELIAVRDELSKALSDTSALEERKSVLEKEIKEADDIHLKAAKALHDARNTALAPFATAIQTSIRSLEMERSVFDVKLEECEPGADGMDSILFVFSSTGQNPVDVAKCASGGEMSRIMLCLKAMMAKYTNMPAMIFDEIDTGVSGSTADKMGSMICSMGAYMQVFAITHLPQVAAKGNAHYIVAKEFNGDNAVTSIHRIDGDERVEEIARMLSGSQVTPEAIANAKSLLAV